MNNIGRVESVRGEICIVKGIDGVGLGNVVAFSSGARGLVLGFKYTDAEVVMLDAFTQIKKGDLVRISSQRMTIGVSESLLGRVIDPIGNPIDGRGLIDIPVDNHYPIDAPARPIYQRAIIRRPFTSGYLAIDSQIPIGMGQRELLLGERQSGQNDVAIDIICNQARMRTSVICIYVAIDSEAAATKRRIERLQQQGAMSQTIAIVGRTSEAASLNYIAPMVGATIAEWFANQGRDVLIIYDDLTHHAKVYRQISLLLDRPASREAYPGDVFYLHARLLERSGSFNESAGGGTITALPIVETQSEDATDYITTNLMSITDGHVLFRRSLANQGSQPPIDSGFSVSRIGSQAQLPLTRRLSEKIKGIIIRYEEIARFMSFGTDISSDSLEAYDLGRIARVVFEQGHDTYYTGVEQAALMYLVVSKAIKQWSEEQIPGVVHQFIDHMRSDVYKKIFDNALLSETYEHAEVLFKECLSDFLKRSDTIKPKEKQERMVAEIETVSKLLQNNEEILTDGKG